MSYERDAHAGEISPRVDGGSFLGHPRGVFLVAGAEMWERFSYYAFVGLLPLFLVAAINANGFAWPDADAVRLFGLYSGLIFASPALGGWLASRYFGERASIFWGGTLIFAGKIAMYFALVAPDIAHARADFAAAGVRLGLIFPSDHVRAILAAAGRGHHLQTIYDVQAWLFAGGLVVTILGTGLLKPAISSIIGMLYAPGDPRRESGFGVFMVGIWIGAFSSNLIAGALGEKFGWQYGFLCAAAGMALGMAAYVSFQQRLLGDAGLRPARPPVARARGQLDKTARTRLLALAVISAFTVIFAAAYYQTGGVLNLMLKNQVDRMVGGFEIPATWFISITTGMFIVATPPIMRFFLERENIGRGLDVVHKVACGLLAVAAGYALIWCATVFRPAGGAMHFGWFALAYACFGVGDVFIWPPQIAVVSRLAPKHLVSLIVGVWYVTVGAGSYLSGVIGALISPANAAFAFAVIFAVLVLAAASALALRPLLVAMMDPRAP